ncbi:DUF1858 domain-containing protein [Devosia algicola]|uniref:DUF1858 domain-containing protein n=1 Tax=Devosia algicola TaxID=3026418 RepID=A0ABY7YPQ7_9HYPH|nr:DUF1858 domain-containing protein [Devosia algicola]WDR03133.1 DUF1858 domain-containing protein [Devosia algicola]
MHDQPGIDMSVDAIMRQWPRTIPVFIQSKMLCVGCPVGPLHSLRDAAAAHGIAPGPLLASIQQLADQNRY